MSTYGIFKVKRSDQVLSILPIHHTYECTLGYLLLIYSGACISYCEGLRHISKNITEFKPSVILSVPLLLEKMYKKIADTLDKSLPQKLKKEGKEAIDCVPFYLKKIVKSKILNSLGGRLRAFVVGAAAVKPELVKAFQKIGIKALQGYGLTECAPLVAGNTDFYMKADAAGLPLPNVKYKIENPDHLGIGEIIVSRT